jgi:hypothetical protein
MLPALPDRRIRRAILPQRVLSDKARSLVRSRRSVRGLRGPSDPPSLGRRIIGREPDVRVSGKPEPHFAGMDLRFRTMRQGWRDQSSRFAECRTTIGLQMASAPLISESNSALSLGLYDDCRDRRHADRRRPRTICVRRAPIPVVLPAGSPRSLLQHRIHGPIAHRPGTAGARHRQVRFARFNRLASWEGGPCRPLTQASGKWGVLSGHGGIDERLFLGQHGRDPQLAQHPGQQENSYVQTNLVSDGFLPAEHTDPNLINPWGVANSRTGPFWVSDFPSRTPAARASRTRSSQG